MYDEVTLDHKTLVEQHRRPIQTYHQASCNRCILGGKSKSPKSAVCFTEHESADETPLTVVPHTVCTICTCVTTFHVLATTAASQQRLDAQNIVPAYCTASHTTAGVANNAADVDFVELMKLVELM